MNNDGLLSAGALAQARLVCERVVSSEELTRLYLDRIERLDPLLGAFVTLDPGGAMAQARAIDRKRRGTRRGRFEGVPTAIKDMNFVRGLPARFGSRAVSFYPPFDDKTVAAMRREGFVFLGKTSASELGALPVTETDLGPPTRNPWALDRSAGGSSGGAGAAVAAGLVPIAQGSDGAGSIRIPSAFNLLFGIKPSRGRVAEPFGQPDRSVVYTMGPIARSVDDAAALLDVLAGLPDGRPHWSPPPPRPFAQLARRRPPRLRVRFTVEHPLGETDPEHVDAVARVVRWLEAEGHEVAPAPPLAATLEEFLPIWQFLVANMPVLDWSLTQPVTRWLAEEGRRHARADVLALQGRIAARVLGWFEGVDLWVTPTVPVAPPNVGAWRSLSPADTFSAAAVYGVFTAPFNLSGQPAASVPAGLSKAGLPLGVQLVAKPFAEGLLLAVCRRLEEAMPWSHLYPPPTGA